MDYQSTSHQYFARLDAYRESTRFPGVVDYRSEGRPYLEPDIPQFRELAKLKKRLTFWKRKAK
jgi:hypothetical protein